MTARAPGGILAAAAALLLAGRAAAGPPTPLDLPGFYGFPGALEGPATAASAGLALADRWLADEPYDNPAAAPARGVVLTPVLQRLSRQDLPARFRSYDQTAAFFDLAGGRLALPVAGFGLSLYAYEPVLRHEDEAFTSRPDQVPGAFTSTADSREVRAGLAVSHALAGTRLGVAGEWTERDDAYDFTEKSGNPEAGTRHAEFSGRGAGFALGAARTLGPRLELAVALRYLAALDLTGSARQVTPLGRTDSAQSVTRASGWEGGVSARWSPGGATRVLASVGGRGAQSWDAFGLTPGPAFAWRVGLDFHDASDPWTARLGVGQEQQSGVPEPRATAFSLGLGFRLESLTLDGGVIHRTVSRPGAAASYDDRLLFGATVPF